MDVHAIESMVRSLGGDRVSSVGFSKVQCSCLLAPWTHSSGRDTHPSMVIFVEGKHGDPIYSCLGCHDRGSLRDLLLFLWMKTGQSTLHWIDVLDDESEPVAKPEFRRAKRKLAGLDFETAQRKRISKHVGSAAKEQGKWFDYLAIAKADDVPIIPEEEYAQHATSVPSYAMERGLEIETCKAWELGHDKAMKRLLFPMRNRKGELVAISGRLYGCPRCGCSETVKGPEKREACVECGKFTPPKYLHSKNFQRNLFLYGESRVDEGKSVYVVEGNLDAPLLWQVGYRPVVAILGSSPGPTQVEKLVARWDKIIVVADGDKAGRSMGVKIREMVAGRVPVETPQLPEGADPGSMAVEQLGELRNILGDVG